MDSAERGRKITEQKERLVSGLDAHIAALEELATTTNFDFDIATDIHPHLIEDSPVGKAQLKKWQDIYASLQNGPASITTLRWNKGLERGCYGFGQEAKYTTKQLWLHVYEQVAMDDIVFIKGDDETPSRVSINKSHDVLEWQDGKAVSVSVVDQAVLYDGRRLKTRFTFDHEVDEAFSIDEVFGFGSTLHQSTNAVDRVIDSKLSLGARMRISDFLYSDAMLQRRTTI